MAIPKRIDQLDPAWALAWTNVLPIVQWWTIAVKTTIDDVKAFVAVGTNIPAGWTTGQVLKKKSNTNFDTEFADSGIPAGWSTGEVLVKNSATSYDTRRWNPATEFDKRVGITVNDDTSSYLDDKLVARNWLSKSVVNPWNTETLALDIDTADTTVFAKTPSYVYTPAFLTGGTSAESNPLIWDSYTDWEFAITIDWVARNITWLNFTAVTDMDWVASVIQAGIRAATGGLETCIWSTNKFVISSVNTTINSAITVTSVVSGGTWTDISGVTGTFMDCDTGHWTVTNKVQWASADDNKWVVLDSGKINATFIPIASDAEATAWTATDKVITPKQYKDNLYQAGFYLALSDNLKISADTERSTSNTTDTLQKKITIMNTGAIRIKFLFKHQTWWTSAVATIYKNGVAYSPAQSTASTTYVLYSFDWVATPWDTIELRLRTQTAWGTLSYVKEFRIYYDFVPSTNWWYVNTD